MNKKSWWQKLFLPKCEHDVKCLRIKQYEYLNCRDGYTYVYFKCKKCKKIWRERKEGYWEVKDFNY